MAFKRGIYSKMGSLWLVSPIAHIWLASASVSITSKHGRCNNYANCGSKWIFHGNGSVFLNESYASRLISGFPGWTISTYHERQQWFSPLISVQDKKSWNIIQLQNRIFPMRFFC